MFIPLRDDQPTVRTPHLTILLILLNSAIFLISKAAGPQTYSYVTSYFGFIPNAFLHSSQYIDIPPWFYATPITYMFLHGGWMHLIGNMLVLWIFGNNVEDYFGHVRFILFYLVSGLAAVALHTLFNPSSTAPLVGASGAIAGVMGAYFVLHPRARVLVLIFMFFIFIREMSAKLVLGIWFGLQIWFSIWDQSTGGGVAWLAHVGGFVFGWALLRFLIKIRGGRGGTPDGGQRVYRVQW
jgi:membrane associated rhomboid family serine protease